ncbi:hypothetical protein AAMO2058_001248500 [Amorphochlora amoebiformis]
MVDMQQSCPLRSTYWATVGLSSVFGGLVGQSGFSRPLLPQSTFPICLHGLIKRETVDRRDVVLDSSTVILARYPKNHREAEYKIKSPKHPKQGNREEGTPPSVI